MSITLDEFVRSLTDTGILPPEEVTSMVSSLPEDRTGVDVEKLAKDLIRQQKLTRFQASVIFRRQSRGLRFGDYIVLDKIGSGGIGQVFKAENRRTGELVALKLLRATFTKSERAVARFYREADTAARLKHRNLISVVDAGEKSGLHFLVMELIEGRDVRSLVKEKGPLPVTTAIDIIMQAAQGLECAHQNGVVHRDIKPANLLLHNSGRVVVLDLGLARLDDPVDESEGEDNQRLTMPGHFLGTLDYVSPEQTADAHEVTAQSDVYSLGCTLYYLLTGQPPYRRDNAALILFAHCQDPIPKLAEKVAGVPERLDELFQRMLAKKAADRVATMTEVIAELKACLDELQQDGKSASAAKRPARPVVAAPTAASPEPHEIAPDFNAERTIDLPPVSDDEVEVAPPAATASPDPLAGTFREISEATFPEVRQLMPSRGRRKLHIGWTMALAGLAIGGLVAVAWIAAHGWPSWLR
jgi:serine/threonine protein kinase